MPDGLERAGNRASGGELPHVPLAIVDAERRNGKAVANGDGRGGVGIQTAAQENDGVRPHASSDSRCTYEPATELARAGDPQSPIAKAVSDRARRARARTGRR